jgi:hypothetical protein
MLPQSEEVSTTKFGCNLRGQPLFISCVWGRSRIDVIHRQKGQSCRFLVSMQYQWFPKQLTYQNDCQVSFDPAGNILVVDHTLSKENTTALYRKSHECIPGKGIARPQSQFLHSCVCGLFIYSQDWFTYFGCSNIDRLILEIYNLSQIVWV